MPDEAIDNSKTSDNITASATEAATSDTGSETTSAPDAGQTVDTSAGEGSETTPNQNGNGSLTTDPSTNQDQNWETWKKRYDGQTRSYNKLRSEFDQIRQQAEQWKDIDPRAIRAWQEQQQRSSQEQLPKWHPKNPSSAHFKSLKDSWTRFRNGYANERDPVRREQLQAQLGQMFTPDEQQALAQWEQHKNDFVEQLAADPMSAIQDLITQSFDSMYESKNRESAAQQEVGQWFDQNSAIVQNDEDAAYLGDLLQRGTPWEQARQLTEQRAKIRDLESKIGNAQRAQQSAEAKDRLLKGEASVTRDQSVSRSITNDELYAMAREEAKKLGIPTDDRRFMSIVQRLSQKHVVEGF